MPLSLVPVMVLRETIRPVRVERDDRGRRGVRDDVAGDVARDLLEPDAVAAAAGDLAIVDAHVAAGEAMDQAAAIGQGNVAAVERDAGEAQAVGAFGEQHRRAAVEDEFGRAAHADELCAARKPQRAGAIEAGRQRQRHLRARRFVDRALQDAGLILGRVGPHAILRGVASERGGERRGARGIGRHRQRTGGAGRGSSEKMAAIEVHDRNPQMARCTIRNAKSRPRMVNARTERCDCWG